ncbi:MAG: aminotransferase class I/II-fold pyridoxal phosphate-dependent enzyme [Bacteroides sp.]|nr:aminotransferase class I/II-fold pyridoxal phosphate-dependent enzyme [Roseburia sp.]MCM1462154.1 aminotransferase class I/II-fold pyridoxal phosphate-dependent enzyme [Bacteroides sp.]
MTVFMEIRLSERSSRFGENIFNRLDTIKSQLLNEGRAVYNFSVGSPDFPPDEHVMKVVSEAALDPKNYSYTLGDIPELTEAARRWYKRRYGVTLDKDEILGVYGSQEGIAHIALPLCDPGDVILVPDPYYAVFELGPFFCGAKIVHYPLSAENGWLPRLDEIPPETRRAAKAMLVSYPANPICKTAPDSFYDELIAFAEENEIFIIHDNAYSEIIYDGRRGGSFLAHKGAKEVGAEFNSLSKTYNIPGLRVSFILGNRALIERFRAVRSQIDYGACRIAQLGAIAALDGPQDSVATHRKIYEERRNALCGGFRSIGWDFADSEGTMFAWAKVPEGFKSSEEFVLELCRKTGVICTPGSSFGERGEGYVRFALVLPAERIAEAVAAVGESGILAK